MTDSPVGQSGASDSTAEFICGECGNVTDGQPCPFVRCPQASRLRQSYADAAGAVRQARTLLMRLDLPEGASKELVRLWNGADIAVLNLVQRLDEEAPDE